MTKEEYQKKIDELNEQKDALKAQIEQVKKEFIDSLLRELLRGISRMGYADTRFPQN